MIGIFVVDSLEWRFLTSPNELGAFARISLAESIKKLNTKAVTIYHAGRYMDAPELAHLAKLANCKVKQIKAQAQQVATENTIACKWCGDYCNQVCFNFEQYVYVAGLLQPINKYLEPDDLLS